MSTRIFFMTRSSAPPAGLATGASRYTAVPCPGCDSICSVAPISDARSCMPMMPMPLSRATSRSGEIEADAVVLDHQPDEPVPRLDQDVDAAGVRVLEHVVERFLRDAVEDGLRVATQLPRGQLVAAVFDRNVVVLRPLAHEDRQRGRQAVIVQRRRAQLPGEKVQVVVDLLGDRQRMDDLFAVAVA